MDTAIHVGQKCGIISVNDKLVKVNAHAPNYESANRRSARIEWNLADTCDNFNMFKMKTMDASSHFSGAFMFC
jgi:hypothetical protein